MPPSWIVQDLTYIRDNVIAMGFPASGVESAYRNDIGHVAEMLNGKLIDLCNCLPHVLANGPLCL